MGGVWMACQLLTHYEFTGDKDAFREEYYPILKGAAQFCLSWLQEDKDGVLQTCPSTSPENEFLDERGRQCSVTRSSAMDITLIYELDVYKRQEHYAIHHIFHYHAALNPCDSKAGRDAERR